MPAPEPNGRDLLDDWRRVMDSVISAAGSVAGRTELPREVLRATQRQVELVQDLVDRERRVQGELAARIVAPLDAVFDLLEESSSTLRRQSEALEAAGAALQETAALMSRQAERFEKTVGALRQPVSLAKAAAGVRRPATGAPVPRSAEPRRRPAPARDVEPAGAAPTTQSDTAPKAHRETAPKRRTATARKTAKPPASAASPGKAKAGAKARSGSGSGSRSGTKPRASGGGTRRKTG